MPRTTMAAHPYFTVEEANALVPELEARFGRILQLRAQLRTVEKELRAQGQPPTHETLQRTDGPPALVAARLKYRGLVEALVEEMAAIEARGVAVKDLDTGLCDFLGQREGRDVWLCWQLGEKAVAFWHDLDAGFAGRQPLDELAARRERNRLLH